MSTASGIDSTLLGDLFGTAAVRHAFADEARIAGMLRFEAALATAEAAAGVIPPKAAAPIVRACNTLQVDMAAIGREAALAGNPAIPLVKTLIAAVKGDAARYVHFGATSQDAIDTGLMLQVADGLGLLLGDLAGAADAAAALARAHRRTPMVGRTFLQHAVPISFGLKAATWLGLATRAHERLRELRNSRLVVQLGGAAGSLSALGDKGVAVTERLARELGLQVPPAPWHTARDGIAEIAAGVAIAAGSMAKIARDIGLLMQSDTAEAFEPAAAGKGGSSTMPQKRNPVGATLAIAAAAQAEARLSVIVAGLAQEHERALGAWHAEWAAIAEIFVLTAGAVAHVRAMLEGLTVDKTRMRANLEASRGLVFAEAVSLALTLKIGRAEAHRRIEEASRKGLSEGRHLRELLGDDAVVLRALGKEGLRRIFDPATHLAGADAFIGRAISAWREERRLK